MEKIKMLWKNTLALLSHDNLNVVNDGSEFFSIYNVSDQ